uniref:Sulfate_transp domain-containing protein n=1 Tax=Parastrongyloides trichosuri TaxID=131310 RepID=A0A0N4ZYS4_PARTI
MSTKTGFRIQFDYQFFFGHLNEKYQSEVAITAYPLSSSANVSTSFYFPENDSKLNNIGIINNCLSDTWYYLCTELSSSYRDKKVIGYECGLYKTLSNNGDLSTSTIKNVELVNVGMDYITFNISTDINFPIEYNFFLVNNNSTNNLLTTTENFFNFKKSTFAVSFSKLQPRSNYGELCVLEKPLISGITIQGRSINSGSVFIKSCYFESYPNSKQIMLETKNEPKKLIYSAKEVPKWNISILLGFQQMMVGITGLLVMPYLVSSLICAGSETTTVRVKLMSCTLITAGVATIIQTTFGLRLAVYQGTAFTFLPPLLAFAQLPDFKCNASENDIVSQNEYYNKLQMMSGSLMAASTVMVICGITGIIGKISRYIGPVTIAPLLILLCLSAAPVGLEKAELHYMSIVQFCTLAIIIFFINEINVPIPYLKNKKITWTKYRLFGNFPYLVAIIICWGICIILTVTNLEKEGGDVRVDKNETIYNIENSPWIHFSYPGEFGPPKFHIGLFAGLLTSCLICMIESVGSYKIVATISEESPPTSRIINRAIIMEGLGCFIAGGMGVGVGVTTYSENVAVLSATKIVSRITVQIAGIILVILGFFTKFAAIISSIPEPLIGGLFLMSFSMVCGVAFANLKDVCLKNSRNVTIIGVAVILGTIIPQYFEKHNISTGNHQMDNLLMSILKIKMFIGGAIAFFLDNIAPGATILERGINIYEEGQSNTEYESDGYWFPLIICKFILKNNYLTKLSFLPSKKMLEHIVRKKSIQI